MGSTPDRGRMLTVVAVSLLVGAFLGAGFTELRRKDPDLSGQVAAQEAILEQSEQDRLEVRDELNKLTLEIESLKEDLRTGTRGGREP